MNKFLAASICIFLSALIVICAVSCGFFRDDGPSGDESTDRTYESGDSTSDTEPDTEADTTDNTVDDTTAQTEADTTAPPVTEPPETVPPETTPPETSPPVTEPKVETQPKPVVTTPPPPKEPQSLSIDFAALQKKNPDIYAWIDIPGTRISYPVLQRVGDDTYYHRRNDRGGYDINGCLYTESTYNGRDFNDPVTVIYGHNMRSGVMFGTLRQEYSSLEGIREHSEIVIYLPGRELHYKVFAGVRFDNRHILYSHDFTNERTYRLFFRTIKGVRELGSAADADVPVNYGEKVIILSTCTSTSDTSDQFRFLVCAKLIEIVEK